MINNELIEEIFEDLDIEFIEFLHITLRPTFILYDVLSSYNLFLKWYIRRSLS
jgi:hypothetical protein